MLVSTRLVGLWRSLCGGWSGGWAAALSPTLDSPVEESSALILEENRERTFVPRG